MAQNTTVTLTAGAWTQLTDADVSSITFQNNGRYDILVQATSDTTAPTSQDGSIIYAPGQGERNAILSDLFPGIASRDRLWAFCETAQDVFVSHA